MSLLSISYLANTCWRNRERIRLFLLYMFGLEVCGNYQNFFIRLTYLVKSFSSWKWGILRTNKRVEKNSACLMQQFCGMLPAVETTAQESIPDSTISTVCESARLLMSASVFSSMKCLQFILFHIALGINEERRYKMFLYTSNIIVLNTVLICIWNIIVFPFVIILSFIWHSDTIIFTYHLLSITHHLSIYLSSHLLSIHPYTPPSSLWIETKRSLG